MSRPLRVGELFAGYSGLGMGLSMVMDAEPAWFVEFDQAPSKILAHHWPTVPNYGDITTVDWAAVEPVDILTGGFPCQDLSHAGKRLGLRPGTRSGLWEHFAYAINELRPRMVVIENVRGLLSASAHCELERDCWCVGDEREPALRALGAVLGDLAELGYDARWGGVRAADAGAPHGRFRVFVVARPHGSGWWGEQRGAVAVRPQQPAAEHPGDDAGVTLLPTPTVGDSKAARNSTATRHVLPPTDIHAGDTLTDILEPKRPRATDQGCAYCGETAEVNPDSGLCPTCAMPHLLPTPKASDGPNGGPGMCNGRGEADALPGIPDFGPYAPAIARWEAVLGRPAPSPTEPGRDERPRLSPRFVEWMMGLPAGHVTDPAIGLTRAQQLKALGNGVCPAQARLAVSLLMGLGAAPTLPTLPTPTVSDGNGAGAHGDGGNDLRTTVALLPTPAVNDMGAGKTPADWDDTQRMKAAHGNGNGHGKSLAIEALRLGAPDELA
jgi:DNA (cytosine-5)-methyltransferase 1